MFARVSLGSPGPLLPMPTPMVAGSLPKTLKKENGAALMAPLGSLVVIHAMGRGNTVASNSLYRSGGDISVKSNCTCHSMRNVDPSKLKRYYQAIKVRNGRYKNTIGL
jgi:hypothetical protein